MCKGFERSQFYNNEGYRRGDLILKQNFQLSLDQLSLSYSDTYSDTDQYIEDEDELQENELVLEDY